MSLQQIIILSLVQGLTEFLPVSSSGHLILMPKAFGWEDQGLLMDVAVHVGTLAAVLLYFYKDVWKITCGFFTLLTGKMDEGGKLFLMLCLATVPAVIFGFSIRYLGIEFRGIETIATTTLLFGGIMFIADKLCPMEKNLSDLSFPKALFFGCFQALALIPGTSRSGACIIAGRILGFKRPEAARFAFLMSIPSIIAAASLTGFEAYQQGKVIFSTDILMLIGLSAFFGLIAIAFMMKWLKSSSLSIFVGYRMLLGLVLLYIIFS